MIQFTVQDEQFVEVVKRSFDQQGHLRHMGAALVAVEAGAVTIELPFSPIITQQHGFFHAGALTAIVDSACGYAALTLMPPESEVLTIEYKVNFLSAARGEKAVAQGKVLRPGRRITVCRGDVFTVDEIGQQKQCATMLATMIRRRTTTNMNMPVK
jgi:uncharacterized protein (TIGR00369 family)